MKITMNLGAQSYPIFLERGALAHAGDYLNLNRKTLIVADSGIPTCYTEAIKKACKAPYLLVFPQGEAFKNMDTYCAILQRMVEAQFSRGDCVVAVGGGVTGDMAGFAAATYMRGIDFYNVPTTLLAQVDSSIGGKVAIDFGGYKNIVGSFYQPKAVVIDPDVLETLDSRQFAAGMAEAIKMAATCDAHFFELLEQNEPVPVETVIARSLAIKKQVVERDERETGLRRVLNFGHTVGHAIETVSGLQTLYHGECVALGMLVMAAPEARARLQRVLKRCGLPTEICSDKERVISAMMMDKKISGGQITVVTVPEIGRYILDRITLDELKRRMEEVL